MQHNPQVVSLDTITFHSPLIPSPQRRADGALQILFHPVCLSSPQPYDSSILAGKALSYHS